VNALPSTASAPPEATSRLTRLLEEIAHLLQTAASPEQFHAEFLQRVVSALRGIAGAVWSRTPQGHFQLQYQINTSEVGLDRIANGRPCHAELLRLAAQRDQPLWVPPRSGPDLSEGRIAAANLTGYGLLLAPILVDGETAGIVEIWQDFYHDSQAWKAAARFLGEVTGFAAAYLHKTRLAYLQDQHRLWVQLEAFARRLHSSLDPQEVAFRTANEGRQLLECDQLSVATRTDNTVRIEAVSGAATVDARSKLVRSMADLCEAVFAWGERLTYTGVRDETWPPAVLTALDAYLVESNARLLILAPLADEREVTVQRRSALLVESFEASVSPDQINQRLSLLAPHAASALFNAVEHDRLPLGALGRGIVRGRTWLRPRGWIKLMAGAACIATVIALLTFVQTPLRREASGQALPHERQTVFAALTGKIVEMKAQNGDRVDRGQELLFLEDMETQLKVEQLDIRVSAAEHRLAVINELLGKAQPDGERDALVRERIDREYELRKASAERAVWLQGSRSPRKTPVTAPLSGTVVTFDAREQLLGKTVKPGDSLLRVAQVEGPWEVELNIPEGSVGHIREGLRRNSQGLEVSLLLTCRPNRSYTGILTRQGLGGETLVKDGATVLPVRVQITDPELLACLTELPVGAEVRAKVNCGARALGYVWCCDLVEFFYEHVWF